MSPKRSPTRAFLTAPLVILLSLGLWNCARAGEKARHRVLLIGVDAGEWDVLGPLLDEQKVPAFAKLRETGASGKIRSLEPLTKSPIIWASVATGKVPKKHGVAGFFVKEGQKERAAARARGDSAAADAAAKEAPATSNLWRARAVWDIVGSLGQKVGVIGWWTTWPAKPVNGFLISDYAQYETAASAPGRMSRRTYPESLDSLVQALRRTPESVSWAELFQFVAPIDTTKVTARQRELVKDLRWIYAADVTFFRLAMQLDRTERPDFFAVYFRGVDAVSHVYWDIDLPDGHYKGVTDEEYRWMKGIIRNYYVFTDRMIAELVRSAGPQTDVIVCSDHGYLGGGKGVMAHKLDGIAFLAGPSIRPGVGITGATVLDVTPTILALFGYPTARDMDGRPIADALKPGVLKRVAGETRLETYETARAKGGSEEPLRSPVDEELRERLRSLGYIQ